MVLSTQFSKSRLQDWFQAQSGPEGENMDRNSSEGLKQTVAVMGRQLRQKITCTKLKRLPLAENTLSLPPPRQHQPLLIH